MAGFSLGGSKATWISLLVAQLESGEALREYSAKADPMDSDGNYTSNGYAALTIDLSLGKGVARFRVNCADLSELSALFDGFDPDEIATDTDTEDNDNTEDTDGTEPRKLTLKEIVEQTISRDPETGVISFKTDLAGRKTNVPDAFLEVLGINPAVWFGQASEDTEGGESESEPVCDIVKRTLKSDSSGAVTFKLSNAAGTRVCKVPAGFWGKFRDLLSEVVDNLPGAVAHFREVNRKAIRADQAAERRRQIVK